MTNPDQPFQPPEGTPNVPPSGYPNPPVDYPQYPPTYPPPPPYPGSPPPPPYPAGPSPYPAGPSPYPAGPPSYSGGPSPYPAGPPSYSGGPPPYPGPPFGYPQGPGGYDPYGRPLVAGTNGMAIASLVCSVAGLLCGLSAIAGVILGAIAMQQTKRTGQQGYPMALAGVITGAALLLLWLGLLVIAAL